MARARRDRRGAWPGGLATVLTTALATLMLGGLVWVGGAAVADARAPVAPDGDVRAPTVPPPASTAPASTPRDEGQARGPSLVVLVRHAEKVEEPASDPPLSPAGEARARELARTLADAGITRIHSSDTRRTRDTAAPLAEALGLEIELYDPRDLPAMAERLAHLPGRHLVVGHSNTTDVLSGLLGGATFGEIEEPWEYDRLYFLTPGPAGFETVLVRFGAAVSPN